LDSILTAVTLVAIEVNLQPHKFDYGKKVVQLHLSYHYLFNNCVSELNSTTVTMTLQVGPK
jgi:hypothetical protein